jgi:3-isopropylmalate/(R)-2-methylmalate dehydratase small subunit
MEPFVTHRGLVAPLDMMNIDTDQIIPAQFLKRIDRQGFGELLFYAWRFLSDGRPNPQFILNDPMYQGSSILVAGPNFGCGSSREHAPWALQQYGFRAIIAPSFADIFRNNCYQNGLLPIILDEEDINSILAIAKDTPGYSLSVDLEQQVVIEDSGRSYPFEIDAFRRDCLIRGLDDIGLTLAHTTDIDAYEGSRRSNLRA